MRVDKDWINAVKTADMDESNLRKIFAATYENLDKLMVGQSSLNFLTKALLVWNIALTAYLVYQTTI